ncbi:ABC transporter substrate-binding protein [Agromyces sp. NPDC056965]|uniref:ABC transporter substrate-binding protein n=1 Tax=Agromyces sp. NPDC056965 TaxID=3345983 RepID=UPI00362940B5
MSRSHRSSALASLLAAGAAVVLAAGLSGCAGTAEASNESPESGAAVERKTLVLQDSTSYTQLPLRFGVEKGFFDDEGLDVEFTQVQDAVTGVATGEITLAFGPTSNYLRAAALGSPIKIVSSAFRSKGPFWLIARDGIDSVEDLAGKTINNVAAGSSMETYLVKILEESGVSRDDVTFVNTGTADQAYGSILAGTVDASIIHQPFPALGEIEGETTTLARGWDFLPSYHTGVLIASDATISDDPELLERALRAYFTTYTYTKEHYDEYLPWLQDQLDTIDPEAVAQAIEAEDEIWDNNPDVDFDAIADTQEIEIAVGNQEEEYDAEKFIDLRFIPQEFVKPFSSPEPKAK